MECSRIQCVLDIIFIILLCIIITVLGNNSNNCCYFYLLLQSRCDAASLYTENFVSVSLIFAGCGRLR